MDSIRDQLVYHQSIEESTYQSTFPRFDGSSVEIIV